MTSTTEVITLLTPIIATLTSLSILNTTIQTSNVERPDLNTSTTIYVGYARIQSANPDSPKEHSLYNLNGQDLSQDFSIQIVCKEADLSVIWPVVYDALIGKNPIPMYAEHSGFTYVQGGLMGFSNENVWWNDIYSLGFPII